MHIGDTHPDRLHRYFSDRVADSEEGRLFLLTRELETLRIGQGLVVPIGLRVGARAG